jgi:hypothetical protein
MSKLEKIYHRPDQISGYYDPEKGIIYGLDHEPDSKMRESVEKVLDVIITEQINQNRKKLNQINKEFLEIHNEIRARMNSTKINPITSPEADNSLNQSQEFSPVEMDRPKLGVASLPGEEKIKPLFTWRFQEPWQNFIHFDPKVRMRRRAKYQELKRLEAKENKDKIEIEKMTDLGNELFDQHPIYGVYQAIMKQCRHAAYFYAAWADLAREVLNWYEIDLENPVPYPSFINENLKAGLSEANSRERTIEIIIDETPRHEIDQQREFLNQTGGSYNEEEKR